jgi:signal transduction histidine kinase
MNSFPTPTQDMLKIIEAVPDLYLILSPDLIIITASTAYLDATFKDRESIQGRHVFEVFPDNPSLPESDATSNLRQSLEWVVEHKKVHKMSLQRYDVSKHGEEGFVEKYWQPLNSPFLDDEGNICWIIHKVEDVTEQIITNRQLKAQMQKADLELKDSQVREQALQHFNVELAAANVEIKTANIELSQAQDALRQLNAELEERVIARTRELKKAQLEAELQRTRLESFFMQAPAAICVLHGPDQVFELVNPGFQRLFPGRELLAKPLLQALPEIVGQPIEQIIREVYQTGQVYEGKEVLINISRYKGTPLEDLYFNFIYQPRVNEKNQVDGIMVFVYEVTDLVRARQEIEKSEKEAQTLAQELKAANEQLTRTNVDLDNFIYTASHDLKAPIANIEGLFMALNKRVEKHYSTKEVLITRMVENSIAKFKSTITHLTEIAKVQNGIDSQKEELSIREVLNDILLDISPLVEKEGAEVSLNLGIDRVWYASKHLRSIIYNLVSNGIKYRLEDRTPVVKVSSYQEGGNVVLEVEDNGMGIESDQLPKLFTMFRRFHNHVEGSGVGLYMIKRIIENNGGSISVKSIPGKGSTFKVVL